MECHFSVRGPKDTPFEGGIYHGKMEFSDKYPYECPKVYLLTVCGFVDFSRITFVIYRKVVSILSMSLFVNYQLNIGMQ